MVLPLVCIRRAGRRPLSGQLQTPPLRSEERRVGKECRSRLVPGVQTCALPTCVAYNMKLECNGSSISLYKEGGATPAIGPITDTAITAAGKAGLRGYLNGYVGDNFQAADLSTVYYQVNAGSFPTPTGGAYKGMFQALTGAMPAPSGIVGSTKVFLLTVVGALGSLYAGIVKQVNKGLSGDVPAGSAGVKKGVAVVRSGNMPGGSGGLNAGVTLHQTLTGIMGSIAAIVTTVLNPIVVIGVKLFKVIGSAFKKLVGG